MRTSLLFFVFLLLTANTLLGQDEVTDLVKEGIALHDEGKYDEAIAIYEKALALDPKSALVHYELGYSYYAKGDYQKALKYTDFVLKQGDQFVLDCYILKGNALDNMGKGKKAIKVYEKALEQFPEEYLLSYNLALSLYNQRILDQAEENLVNAIYSNLAHSSSHVLLAQIQIEKGERIPAVLSLFFFLLVEPVSSRAESSYEQLIKQMQKGVQKEDDQNININLSLGDVQGDFSAAELMLSLSEASKYTDENKDKTEEELFVKRTETLITVLDGMKEGKSGIWWELYIDFYSRVQQAEHLETFCYMISQVKGETVTKWLDEHPEKVEAFLKWLEE